MAPTALVLNIENRIGALAEVARLLSDAGVNVAGVQLGRGPDQKNLRLVVDKPEAAIAALAKRGFDAKRTEVLSVKVRNRPGAIAQAAERLAAHGVNIEAVFLSAKTSKRMEIVLQVDDVAAARKALGESSEEE